MTNETSLQKLLRISLALLILIPGIFKVLKPEAFLEYLSSSPVQIPFGKQLFWPVTSLEIIGSLLLLYNPFSSKLVRPAICLMFSGILLTALITVAIPDATNNFSDQVEMGNLYHQAHPERKGLNIDIFPSKIGLISILFHFFGIALFLLLAFTGWKEARKGQ